MEVDMDGDRLMRLTEILTVIPVSRSGWWKGIKEGRFPAGTKLGPKTTVWRESTIRDLIVNGLSKKAAKQ